MKKLVIIAAIAMSAMFAQAAATSWQLTAGQMFSQSDSTVAFSGLIEVYASGGDLAEDVVVFSQNPAAKTYNKTAFTTEALTAGKSYDFYLVLTDGKYQYTSATKAVTALETGAANIAFGSLKTATTTAGNWVAVPEPTSGLLMLVGLAGLALRRRRA
ncbi:MAG: PEP-CTERM sorting domain-containing protein [Oscillospiraceae bacterium]|nr:PEP-CTERM sorting domain-containing protein [Oscillospiraceae bacterium]